MPLYEMDPMAKGKRDLTQDNCSNDLPFIPENDFVELVWENGQVMMQSQSCRARKNNSESNSVTLSPHETKARVRDIGNASNSRTGKIGIVDSVFSESPFSVPTAEMGLSEDENVVPWLNYPPIDGSLQHLYGSDIFPEISGVTVNETFSQNTFPSIVKRYTSNQTHKDFRSRTLHNHMHTGEGQVSKVSGDAYNGPATSNVESVQFYPFSSQQCQKSLQISASNVTNSMSSGSASHLSVSRESTGIPTHVDVPFGIKTQKQGPESHSNKSSLMNFSHFARPAAHCRASFQNTGAEAGSGISKLEPIGKMDNGPIVINSAPTESTLVRSNSDSKKDANSRCEATPMPSKVDSKPLEPKGVDAKPPKATCEGDAITKNNGSNDLPVESSNKRPMDGGKPIELIGASSSVCSGNSVERVSDDPKANMKRKCHDTEESVCHSEDVEAESERVKIMASRCSNGSKRSRAAEVHNLSERRRRDKINEKMRALQELIPNCNKVDKASMLDEAIEYLRTLQLQVQIMSMGAGLYMPSMMLPMGMQHINPAHMSYFMPMGVGMGYGMGMLDLNGGGGSSGSPMVQFPPMQGAHFSSSPMPGPQPLHGLPGSNLQMFGHPGQGFPMSMPQAHGIPLSGGSHVNSSTGLNGSPLAGQLGNSCPNSIPSSIDPIQNINSQAASNTAACGSEVQTLKQCQTANVDLAQMQNDNQTLDAGALPSADD